MNDEGRKFITEHVKFISVTVPSKSPKSGDWDRLCSCGKTIEFCFNPDHPLKPEQEQYTGEWYAERCIHCGEPGDPYGFQTTAGIDYSQVLCDDCAVQAGRRTA